MAFDAIKEKKVKKSRKEKKVNAEINRLTKVYPIAGITADNYVVLKRGETKIFMAVLETKKYDLHYLDDNEADFVINSYWNFLKMYSSSVKEIFMNFPEQNQKQQEYFKYMIEKSGTEVQLKRLQMELDKLKFLEKEYKKLASYLCVFGYSVNELEDNIRKLRNGSDKLFHSSLLTKDSIRTVFNLLNNTGGIKPSE